METLYFYDKSLKIIRKRQEDIRETICHGPVNDFESFKELRAKLQELVIIEQELKNLLEREEKNG